jgi:hypothetical protein
MATSAAAKALQENQSAATIKVENVRIRTSDGWRGA